MTKHQQLLQHIEDLPVGHKISVRQVAKMLDVSEGTAYRAIKEAEARGLVSTMPRVGTVRIEQKSERDIQRLTFAEVVNIVDGTIQGGRGGLHKALSKFLIGAMELESMAKYIETNSLIIVGDREEAQRLALSMGAGVLITGGFEASHGVREMADSADIPILSSSYDTFTTASMINQAIHDRMIKKDIARVEELVVRQPFFLRFDETVQDWLNLSRETGHSRFPVVDWQKRVVGIITGRDVAGIDPSVPIDKVMTKKPTTVGIDATVASVAHQMVWQGIELLPVVKERELLGVVTRQDVIKSLQQGHRQPQVQMTHADIVLSQFDHRVEGDSAYLIGFMPPVTMDKTGSASQGALLTVMIQAATILLRQYKFQDIVLEAVSSYFLHPVPLEREVNVKATLIDIGRQVGKVEMVVHCDGKTVCKAMVSVQSLNQ